MKKNIIFLLVLTALVSFKLSTATIAKVKTDLPAKGIPMGLGFNVHIKGTNQDWDNIKASGANPKTAINAETPDPAYDDLTTDAFAWNSFPGNGQK